VRPLRTHFQNLLEVWGSNRELSSGNLAPELVSHLGNINQLILEGLLTEDKSAWIEMGEAIITLDDFSAVMLKGDSPLFQRLPQLIEATGDAGLRWKYTSNILENYHRLIEDPDRVIRDGVQHYNAGTHPAKQGDVIFALL
jgi:hypothetical protein